MNRAQPVEAQVKGITVGGVAEAQRQAQAPWGRVGEERRAEGGSVQAKLNVSVQRPLQVICDA
jgi:hypothetical protein